MMPYKIYRIVPMLAFCLLFSVSALAGVRLEAPDKAGQRRRLSGFGDQ